MNHAIGVVIPFTTNDYRFFRPNILQIKKFAREIVAVYTDHFFNGDPENLKLINKMIRENPEVRFVENRYREVKAPVSEKLCRLLPRTANLRPFYGPQYWPCMARWLGYQALSKKLDYLLFLDADEIVDGGRFLRWLDTGLYRHYASLIFACYYYFRDPSLQAETLEECGLLIKNQPFARRHFFSYYERRRLYQKITGPKLSHVRGDDDLPLIHHYSWARGKKEMLQKVKTWGHSRERDWEKMVRGEFYHPFNGTDFLRGYRYRKVKPFLKLE